MSTHIPDPIESDKHGESPVGKVRATHNITTRHWQTDTIHELRELLAADGVSMRDVTIEIEQTAIPLDEPRV